MMPPLTQDALPWYQFLSIDLLLHVAKSTFLSPILCWLYPLALRAQAFHWHMTPLRYAVAFACVVDFFWFLSVLNSLGRNGRFSKTKVEVVAAEEVEDVVVVTGGSSGLGQIVAEIFALKGISVAVLDIKKPSMEGNYDLQYYECDVSDITAVQRVSAQITKDLGTPTILVNCAVTISSNEKLVDTPISTIEKEIGTNILGNFYTIKEFLPGMQRLKRGHIVTVSSALGYCGPARLSAYSTSKAALLSLHEAITAELGLSSPVKTTLVVTGQMYTPLFYGVRTPSTFIAPIVEPLDVARQIIQAVENRQGGEIYAPWYVGYMYNPPSYFRRLNHRWIMRGLPVSLSWFVRWIGGVDTAMEEWRGAERFSKEQGIVMENGKH